jgi:hypothetical protein
MMNQGITYNPQVASIAQQLVAQNQPIDSVINHVGPGASLAALVNAYKQAQDRARREQIQGAEQAGNDGSGLAGMMPQNKTVADEVYASLQQGQAPQQAPQQEPTAMMAHGGLANLPSYNFMPHNYEHGGIVAFKTGDEVEALLREGEPVTREGSANKKPTPQGLDEYGKEQKTPKKTPTPQGLDEYGKEQKGPNKYQPSKYNPEFNPKLGSVKEVAGKIGSGIRAGLLPEAARQLGTTGIRLFKTDTEDLRKNYGYGAPSEGLKGMVEDMGVRGRAALEDIVSPFIPGFSTPLNDAFGPGRTQPAAATPAVSPPPSPTPETPADISKYLEVTRGTGAGGAGVGMGRAGNLPVDKKMSERESQYQQRLENAVLAATPQSQEYYVGNEKKLRDASGIGKANQDAQARLTKQEAGIEGESKAAFYRDLSKAGFSMAAFAGKRGREATGFLGALAAGGQDFSESNIKTAARFNELREKMEDRKYALAQADEALKLGDITRGSAQYKDATTQFRKAQEDFSKHEGDMVKDAKTAASRMDEINLQGRYHLAAAAAGREDRNTAVKKLSDAYYAAVKAKDAPAQKEILKQIGLLNAASVAGVVSQEKTEVTNRRNFSNDKRLPTLQMQSNSIDPAVAAKARQEIESIKREFGIPSSTGGGASANRLTTDANGMLIYNPQQPIE